LWGYSNRQSPATGTLDPLYARVLVLEAGRQSLALVDIDLGRPFGPASLQWLRNAARQDVSFLILTATHTHSGPVIQDDYPGGKPAWETAAKSKPRLGQPGLFDALGKRPLDKAIRPRKG
jgi:hypothetical protein